MNRNDDEIQESRSYSSRGNPYHATQAPHCSENLHCSQGTQGSQGSQGSQSSTTQLLPPRGNYKTLLSYQKSLVIFQMTCRFCELHLRRGDRTIDQMVQAARSGKQNIIEGSKAALTSRETEIKLTNVARASLEELLEDYCDYLRVRDLPVWAKDSREATYVRNLGKTRSITYDLFRQFVETRPPEVVANIAICLIHQANYLLDRQVESLGKQFLQEGGLRERMTRARIEAREQKPKH